MLEQNLYIALLGGKHEKANIEVHDVIPFIGANVQAAFPYLKQQWFGLKNAVHVDAWMKINGVEYKGTKYRISIQDTPSLNTTLKLYLINLGAYLPEQFGEVHKYLIVAGTDSVDAKSQAKLAIEQNWFKPHTDAIIDVDDCLALDQVSEKFIHLVEGEFEQNIYQNDYLIIP